MLTLHRHLATQMGSDGTSRSGSGSATRHFVPRQGYLLHEDSDDSDEIVLVQQYIRGLSFSQCWQHASLVQHQCFEVHEIWPLTSNFWTDAADDLGITKL
nr:hypothetical protein CFP56_58159 [Quercus suber]